MAKIVFFLFFISFSSIFTSEPISASDAENLNCSTFLMPSNWPVIAKPLTTRTVYDGTADQISAQNISTYVSAVGVLHLENGSVLMLKRGEGNFAFNGQWTFPGGLSEPGETPEQTLIREFKEETGLSVVIKKTLGARKTDRPHQGKIYIIHRFEVSLIDPTEHPVITLSNEHSQYQFVKDVNSLSIPWGVTRELFLETTGGIREPSKDLVFPLKNYGYVIPQAASQHLCHPGSFGAIRQKDIHTGVDLYTEQGAGVYAMETGIVVNIENFTGPNADDPSPWWNDTQAILIRGSSGVILYGELISAPNIRSGQKIEKGQLIGVITPVLKKDKGKNPINMLHIELYDFSANRSVWWKLDEPQPTLLKDITPLLLSALGRPAYTLK